MVRLARGGSEIRGTGMRRALGDAQRRAARARIGAISRSDGRIARPTSASGAPGIASLRIGSFARRGSPPNGLSRRGEESLDDPVLQRMEAHTAICRPGSSMHDARQCQRELRELAVNENPESLERPRGRILTPITPRSRADGLAPR
jgi:hypothetical protein